MHDLSLHILDLIENSLGAQATIVAIRLEIDRAADQLVVTAEDNGIGICAPPEQVLNPFYTTHKRKRVGLGLSFFKAAAELAGGELTLSKSAQLGGVAVRARMELTHVNRPPLGDLATTISTMVLMHPHVDFRLHVRSGSCMQAFHLSEFVKTTGFGGGANVRLANSVLAALRAELEPWMHSELLTWAQTKGVRSKTLAEAGAPVFASGKGSQLVSGAEL